MPSRIALRMLATVVLLWGTPGEAVSPYESTPTILAPKVSPPLQLEFLFAHHFQVIGPKLLNSPTFTLELGIIERLSAAVRYSTSSDVGPDRINEVEPLLKFVVLREGAPLQLMLIGAYNTSAESVDGAVLLKRTFGRLSLHGSLSGFQNGYGVGTAGAAGFGLGIQLTRHFKLVGDVHGVVLAQHPDRLRARGWQPAWSGGIAFEIPYTGHAMNLYVTNTNTLTLQGAARGTDALRVGFNFYIPFGSLARWGEIFAPVKTHAPAPTEAQAAVAAPGKQVSVDIVRLKYSPEALQIAVGTTVEWTNHDKVPHTVTEIGGAWDSGEIPPGGTFRRTFDQAGTVNYYCTVHPFMKARLEVH